MKILLKLNRLILMITMGTFIAFSTESSAMKPIAPTCDLNAAAEYVQDSNGFCKYFPYNDDSAKQGDCIHCLYEILAACHGEPTKFHPMTKFQQSSMREKCMKLPN